MKARDESGRHRPDREHAVYWVLAVGLWLCALGLLLLAWDTWFFFFRI